MLLCLFQLPFLINAQQKDTTAMRYSKNITAGVMSENLHVIASDAYEGRETGKRGQKMAAVYIAKLFKAAGIPPYKDTTYFQQFMLNIILPKPAEILIDGKKYDGNKDYFNLPGQIEQRIDAENVQFLGYGIQDENYDDYKGVDVKDKVVMILSGEPVASDSLSLVTGKKIKSMWSSYYKVKLEKARENKVKVLLIASEDIEKEMLNNKRRIESPSMKLEEADDNMVIVYISKQMAEDILQKETIESIKQKISAIRKPLNILVKTKITIKIKNEVEKVGSENVLAYVEGSDLKDQLVVVTAHYDHLGMEGDKVFNGADDDGSGTVAVIELAKTFEKAKKEGHGPRRSMLFMTVAGEEKGLLGSSYYVQNPVYPLKNTVCDLNIDMIGRVDPRHENNPDYIYLIGSDKLSSQLHNISETANKTYSNLELDYTYNDEKDRNRFYYRSDHYNFAKNGIPVIFYFNGVHADYHKETDEVEKINFNKMEKITRLVFFTAWELANRNERIKVDSNKK